ncbi:MAG: phosphoglucosamine mutase [Acidobacteriia bacterium]|nr:phosphoglucosamine mutase [Terriglobia bacterium]
MARKLFGTDGIRGVAGEYPLDPPSVHAVGRALGLWCLRQHRGSSSIGNVLVGMDTRESGGWIAAELASGLARVGVPVRFAGLITTPGVAYLTRTGDFVAGVMISASHNPFQDNGIKIFGHSGYKLPDATEHALEEEIFSLIEDGAMPPAFPLVVEEQLDQRYLDYLASTVSHALHGMTVVVDCGHGAASHLAAALLERLGARVHSVGCAPNGRNINLDCGVLHVELLARTVEETGAGAGFAFDGDADRCIAVAASGKIVDGDHVMLVCARDLLHRNQLNGNGHGPVVVATVMSNLGLEKALAGNGVGLVRTPVGDKYVLEEMLRRDAPLGGEQSGHIIFLKHATTGDGLLTALTLLDIMASTGKSLDELTSSMNVYPQKLVNVRVQVRRPLEELDAVRREIRAAESELGVEGRVLVRFSGTEPLARVMVEGPAMEVVETLTGRIAAAIRAELCA